MKENCWGKNLASANLLTAVGWVLAVFSEKPLGQATPKKYPCFSSPCHERYDEGAFFSLPKMGRGIQAIGEKNYHFSNSNINDLQKLLICMFPLAHCIPGTVSFNLIPNMTIFIHVYHVFSIKICKKEKKNSPKDNFGDARGDEKQVY